MVEKPLVVGIGYKARQGKNILAQKIVEALEPGTAQICSFATALKAFCRASGWMTAKDPRILQIVGTDLMRSINPDVWVNCLRYQLEEERPDVALITDMRFPNEFDFCKERGFTIRLARLNEDGSQFLADDRPSDHPSEIALDGRNDFDFGFQVRTGDRQTLGRLAGIIATEIEKRLA